MKNIIIIKPILWRLLIWNTAPITIAWLLGRLVYQIIHHYSILTFDWATPVGVFIGATVTTIVFRKKYHIVISEADVSGVGTGFSLNTVTFPVRDLDKLSMHKQSIFEKIGAFHTIRSNSGQKIMCPHFIYGEVAVSRVYEILEHHRLESTDQKSFALNE